MRQFFKQYLPFYKDYIRRFFFAFIGMVLVSIGTAGTAYIIKPVLDEIFINKDVAMLQLLPIGVILLYTAKGVGQYIQSYYILYIGHDIIRRVRDNILSHLIHLDLGYFYQTRGGELISRITNDITRIQTAVSNNVADIIRESLTIVALMVVVIMQSPKLALYGLIVLPIIIYPLSILAKKMKRLSTGSQEAIADLTSHLSEIFNNIEIIMAQSTQKIEHDKFKKQNQKFFDISIRAVKTNELTSPFMEIIGSFAAALVIGLGGMEVINGNMSVGEFFSFMTALFMLYAPIKRLSKQYNHFQDAIAANDRLNDIFALQTNIVCGTKEIDHKIQNILFNNVSLKYDNKTALQNVTLSVNKGDKIALVGDSGGGKSSLVNLIIRFYDPIEGSVEFDGVDIKEFKLQALRDSISIVTQRVYIFNDTIANNVAYGKELDRQRVEEVLKKANIWDFVSSLDDGIDTKLDEFGANLSGGQRQRIAIARALYKEPQILIFDEATSALDNESEAEITKTLNEISKDKITFVIAHRLSTIKDATKIFVFKDGKIVCEGEEKYLLKECKEYQRLYNLATL